jgi:hypothetical protein
MITYPLSTPAALLKTNKVTWRAKTAVSITRGQFTGQTKAFAHQGEWWELEIETAKMTRPSADQLEAFIVSLRGQYGTFKYGDPARKAPQGGLSGPWAVNGTIAAGSRTVPAGYGAGAFSVGDWLQIGAQLVRVINVIDSGHFDVFPIFRSAIPDGTPIIYNGAQGIFRLSGEVDLSYGLSKNAFGPYVISAMEAFA